MIRPWRFEISPKNSASFFAFERSVWRRQNAARQSRNAKRLLSLAMLTALASCAEYQEPQANCFSFLASLNMAETPVPDCTFAPLGRPEDGIDV